MANPKGQSKSAKFFNDPKNKASLENKRRYNQKYKKGEIPGTKGLQAQEKVKEATKMNRKNGTYGNGDGKDLSHPRKGKKGFTLEKQSKNRGNIVEKQSIVARRKRKKLS